MGQFSTLSGVLNTAQWHPSLISYAGIPFAGQNIVVKILICTHNPLLMKSCYGLLRDEGYGIEVVEQPSAVIQRAPKEDYAAVIIDSESFGLSIQEIVGILRTIVPDMPVLVIGDHACAEGALSVKTPLDLEEFREVFHSMNRITQISQNQGGRTWQ